MKAIFSVLLAGVLYITAGAQIPILNSYPSASAVIFLDFDGQVVEGTSWNWSGPINALGAGLSASDISEIFNRVAEDYRIFNLNITTDSTVYATAPSQKRSRVIITPTYEWYGQAGGVSYVGSFTWGDDTPAWVFSGLLHNNIKYISEAVSHEAGHTLGLQHQSNYDINCIKTAEYSGGQGSGEISWAPIMGVGYYKNITTWHNGPNAYGCSYLQNDIDIIAASPNNIGLRSDDHGDNHQQATHVVIFGNSFQANGLINTANDKDVFSITLASSTRLHLSAVPQSVGNNNAGADIDLRVSLLSATGDTLSRYNPMDLLNAGIDTNLNMAMYYLVVEGVGNANLLDYGSLGFYYLNGNLEGVLPLRKLFLSGNNYQGAHQLKWNYQSDEVVRRIEVESSLDGILFSRIASKSPGDHSLICQPFSSNTTYYRIKVIMEAGESFYYSNMVALRSEYGEVVKLHGNIITDELVLTTHKGYAYQIFDGKGGLLKQGELLPGLNHVYTSTLPAGLLLLKAFDKSGSYLFKLIKQ